MTVITGLIVLALLQGPPPGKGPKHKDKGRSAERVERRVFGDRDRDAWRDWRRETYGRNCPPGLAKKNNGCLPPGIAKKRYSVGQRLPVGVDGDPLPSVLRSRLDDPRDGYRYGIVDGDLLLIETATRLVVDALEGLID